MRLTSLVVWKSWASNKLRTALTVAGIALGVAVVVAIHVLDHNTIQSRLRELRPDFGRVDFELVPADRAREPDEVRRELLETEGIGAVGLLHEAHVVLRAGDAPTTVGARLYGLSPLPSAAFAHYVVGEGADLGDLGGDAFVLLSAELAAELAVGVGDAVVVEAPRIPPAAVCKDGELVRREVGDGEQPMPQHARVRGILAHHGLARRNFGRVLIGTFALAKRMAPGQRSFFQVNRVEGADADRLRQRLSDEYQVLDEHSALLGEAADERAFRNGVKILGCLALVLGMFVVFQTLSQSLVERLRQIGLLRCLGASRRSVVAIFLVDAVAMAAAGVTIGVGLGIGLAKLMQVARFTTLGVGKTITTAEIPWGPVLWTASIGLLFTLAGALFPLWKARSVPAVRVLNARGLQGERGADVLRGVNVFLFVLLVLVLPGAYLAMTPLLGESERETRAVLLQLGGLVLAFGAVLLLSPGLVRSSGRIALAPFRRAWPLPAFLVERGLERQSGRYAASVCGLAIVLLAMIALSSLTAALRGEIRAFGDRAYAGRVFVGTAVGVEPAAYTALREVPGVRQLVLHEGRVQVPFLLSGIALDALARDGQLFDRQPELGRRYLAERSVVVSERLARLYAIGQGDTIGVLTDEGRKAYAVLAVSDEAGHWVEERAWAIADPGWLARDFCVGRESVQHATFVVEPGSVRRLRSAVHGALPEVTAFKAGESIVAYHLRDLWRDFLLFDVLLWLILALAVTGLVNQMTIAALARVREIGVLRALGMQRVQLRRAFVVESMVIATLAAGTAVLLGLPLGWLVVDGLERVTGLEAPFVVPWTELVAVVVIAGAVGVVAAILPGLRAIRMSPAQSVRYE